MQTKPEIASKEIWDRYRSGEKKLIGRTVTEHTFNKHLNANSYEFNDCEIGTITFDDARVTSIVFRNCPSITNIEIRNIANACSFYFIAEKDMGCKIENITIDNCSIQGIQIANAKLENVTIKNDKFLGNQFSIDNKNLIVHQLTIVNQFLNKLSFEKCNVDFLDARIRTIGAFEVKNDSTFKNLKITGDKIGTFTLSTSSIDKIDLDLKILEIVKLAEVNFHEHFKLTLDGTTISSFEIRSPEQNKFLGKLLEFKARERQPSITAFHVTGMAFDKVDLNKVQRVSSLTFHNTRIEKELNLCGLILPNVEFNIFSIKNALLKIHRTEFDKLKLVNVNWPYHNRAYELDDVVFKNNKEDYIFQLKNLKDSYRKLKVHFLVEHNYFDAMLFATNELRIEQRIKYLETWSISVKSFFNNLADWIVLGSNKVFSNFGLSWTRPLFSWLIIHFVFVYFILSCFDLGIVPAFNIKTFVWVGYDSQATKEGIYFYLKLLFPVHDADVKITIDKATYEDNIWGSLDFFIRIIAPYFIFLIIRGTRKFNFKVG